MKAVRRTAIVAGVLGAFVVLAAPAASAHPLGNATVNHYDALHLYPDHLTDLAVEDIAEIPTLQRKSRIDTDGDGLLSAAERARYAAAQCRALAGADRVTVNGARRALTVDRSGYTERPGAIGLRVGRLECQLTGRAKLSGHAEIAVADRWDGAGIGWHEITAVGTGVTLRNSPFPATSISDALRHYPNDLLSSPLDVRSGTVTTDGGAGASTYASARHLPVAGGAVRLLNRIATTFNHLAGAKHLTVGVGLLAILLSLTLGAGHAFLPGHGKTIMAAYLVGRRGRLRDVVTVGATVTITHTLGVLVLGLAISLTSAFAPTAAEQDLGILSGLIVAGVGVGLLTGALRRRPWRPPPTAPAPRTELAVAAELVPAQAHGPIPAGYVAVPPRSDTHLPHHHGPHDHGPHHHGPGHAHSHRPAHAHDHDRGFGRTGLVGLGVAGGLVPSPSALLVLLAAIALGRTAFGVILVLGYGLGMAAALSAAGLLLVHLRDRLDWIRLARPVARLGQFAAVLPLFTALLVLTVGLGLTLRAASGTI